MVGVVGASRAGAGAGVRRRGARGRRARRREEEEKGKRRYKSGRRGACLACARPRRPRERERETCKRERVVFFLSTKNAYAFPDAAAAAASARASRTAASFLVSSAFAVRKMEDMLVTRMVRSARHASRWWWVFYLRKMGCERVVGMDGWNGWKRRREARAHPPLPDRVQPHLCFQGVDLGLQAGDGVALGGGPAAELSFFYGGRERTVRSGVERARAGKEKKNECPSQQHPNNTPRPTPGPQWSRVAARLTLLQGHHPPRAPAAGATARRGRHKARRHRRLSSAQPLLLLAPPPVPPPVLPPPRSRAAA